MNKRIISLCTAALLSVSLLAGCSGSGNGSGSGSKGTGEDVLTLKGGCTYNTTSASFKYVNHFADILKEVSGGKMSVEWNGGSTLGNTAQHYAQLKNGTLDLFSTGFDTATTLEGGEDFAICVVPYVFNDSEHMEKFLKSDLLQEMLAKVEPNNNVKFLGNICMNLPRGLSTTNTPVYTPDDVKGLKLRVPESPSVVAVWEAWGASPVQISVSELFTSLEGGIADGQDNNVLSMWANSYYEVQKYYMELEYIQNAQVLWISQSTWDKLTDEQQGWVSEAVERAHDENTADAQAEYAESKKNCEEGGMEFIEFDREAFVSSAEKLAREMEGDLFSAGLYDQIKALDEA